MFDAHYDLLSIAYVAYLRNDFTYLEKISKYFNENNVTSVIANLYFMSKEEMNDELDKNYFHDDVSVLDMFIKSKEVLDLFLPNTKIIYSIEGADFIKDENELRELYNNGLNSIVIAWNTQNKYASGNRSNQGLTEEGKTLIKTAISLGMGIDLSHANKETFSDLIEVIKEEKESNDVICYASHSNCRSLCDRERNLTDSQILQIKEVGGMVGVFSNRNFIVPPDEKDTATKEEQSNYFFKHIKHMVDLIGSSNVMVATDDMDFCKDADSEYGKVQIYDYGSINNSMTDTLRISFSDLEVSNIMYNNANKNIYDKIKEKRRNK